MSKGKGISEAKTDSQKIAQNQLEIHNLKHLFNDMLRYFQTFVEFSGVEKEFKEYVEGGSDGKKEE